MKKYSEIRNSLKTGDVVAFSGSGPMSTLIKAGTLSHISHMGIVTKEAISSPMGQTLFLYEATSLAKSPDFIRSKVIKGAQMQLLSKRLAFEEGRAYVYPLKNKLSQENCLNMTYWLRTMAVQGVPYDYIQAVASGLGIVGDVIVGNEPDFSRLFCFELVAGALQIAKEFDKGFNPSSANAKDIFERVKFYPCYEVETSIEQFAQLDFAVA